MAMTVETAQLNNQSILQNFGLVEELDEQAAEIISGGGDTFTVRNTTNHPIYHRLDASYYVMRPGEERKYAGNPGMIAFDTDTRPFSFKSESQKLDDGKIYEFKLIASNPNMIELKEV